MAANNNESLLNAGVESQPNNEGGMMNGDLVKGSETRKSQQNDQGETSFDLTK